MGEEEQVTPVGIYLVQGKIFAKPQCNNDMYTLICPSIMQSSFEHACHR